MEIEILGVPFLRKGNKIHVKKKNRGKFTRSAKRKHQAGGILDAKTNKRFIYNEGGVPLDEVVITGNNPEKLKRQQDWKRRKELVSYLPIVGTAVDVAEAIKDPNFGTIMPAAFGLVTDLAGGKVVHYLGKAASRTVTNPISRTGRRHISPKFTKLAGAAILNLEDMRMNALQNQATREDSFNK